MSAELTPFQQKAEGALEALNQSANSGFLAEINEILARGAVRAADDVDGLPDAGSGDASQAVRGRRAPGIDLGVGDRADRCGVPGQTLSMAEVLAVLGYHGEEFIAVCCRPISDVFRAQVTTARQAGEVAGEVSERACVWFSPNATTGPVRQGGRRGDEGDVTRWAATPLDLDVETGGFADIAEAEAFIDALSTAIGTRPTVVIHSGHGLQPIWAVSDGYLDDEQAWEATYRLTRRFGRWAAEEAMNLYGAKLDTVSDLSRLVRVPGTMNWKDPQHPVPTSAVRDTGRPLTVKEIEDFLDRVSAVEIESDQPVFGEIVSDCEAWDFGTEDCAYVQAMVPAWGQESDRPTAGRHQWAMKRAVKLASAYRLGCITEDGLIAALEALEAYLTYWCLEVGDHRPLHYDEIGGAFRGAMSKVQTFTHERVRRELGDHRHPQRAEESCDSVASFDEAVNARLHRLRVEEAARQLFAREKTDPAAPFDAGLLADFQGQPLDQLWRIGDLLPADGSMLVVAQRKAGKTTLMLNLARCLLTGELFLGRFSCRKATGKVAILNYEVGGHQLAAWARGVGVPEDGLVLANVRGRRNPLAHEEDRRTLAALLRDQGVETVIVDPFGQAFTGKNQNDAGEVDTWLKDLGIFTRTEVGARDIILTAHAGWNGERSRGSSALEGWADSVVTLTFGSDQRSRYLRAIGRDVGVDEDLLSFDPGTRLMAMTGVGSRKQATRVSKAQDLIQPVCDAVRDKPGASATEVVNSVRALRNDGAVTIAFQDNDVRKAIAAAVEQGLLRREELGPGKPIKHYLVDPVQPQSGADPAGRAS